MKREEYDARIREIYAQEDYAEQINRATAKAFLADEYIASLEAENKQLRNDNEQLIEQVNRFAVLADGADYLVPCLWLDALDETHKQGE